MPWYTQSKQAEGDVSKHTQMKRILSQASCGTVKELGWEDLEIDGCPECR